MTRFSERMVTEVVQQFWAAMARGEFIADAAAEAGTYRVRSIARRLGRHPSTVSRELGRNAGDTGGYRATTAHALAYE